MRGQNSIKGARHRSGPQLGRSGDLTNRLNRDAELPKQSTRPPFPLRASVRARYTSDRERTASTSINIQ